MKWLNTDYTLLKRQAVRVMINASHAGVIPNPSCKARGWKLTHGKSFLRCALMASCENPISGGSWWTFCNSCWLSAFAGATGGMWPLGVCLTMTGCSKMKVKLAERDEGPEVISALDI